MSNHIFLPSTSYYFVDVFDRGSKIIYSCKNYVIFLSHQTSWRESLGTYLITWLSQRSFNSLCDLRV